MDGVSTVVSIVEDAETGDIMATISGKNTYHYRDQLKEKARQIAGQHGENDEAAKWDKEMKYWKAPITEEWTAGDWERWVLAEDAKIEQKRKSSRSRAASRAAETRHANQLMIEEKIQVIQTQAIALKETLPGEILEIRFRYQSDLPCYCATRPDPLVETIHREIDEWEINATKMWKNYREPKKDWRGRACYPNNWFSPEDSSKFSTGMKRKYTCLVCLYACCKTCKIIQNNDGGMDQYVLWYSTCEEHGLVDIAGWAPHMD